jgi:hypothetical protein
MKRPRKGFTLLLLAAALCIAPAPRASAQFGISSIKRPNIANIFHPVVGQGAAYDTVDKDGKKSHMEMYVVDKETVGTAQGYWMEVGHTADANGNLMYGKMLVTPADFKFHKMIFVMPGQTQPMEMDMDAARSHQHEMEDKLDKWHSVGSETITVPAGTFSCEHWTSDDGKGDVWASSKISPMGLVKSIEDGRTMVLVRTISDAKSKITGTPVKFDPKMMMQQRMQQHQQQNP